MITYEEWCSIHTDIRPMIKRLRSSLPEQYVGFYLSKNLNVPIEYSVELNSSYGNALDIYFPTLNMAVEYDGVRFHGNKLYHDEWKARECKKRGIILFHIREAGLAPIENCKRLTIDYKPQKDYSNISEAISELCARIKKKLGIQITVDVDIKRDSREIIAYVQDKYFKHTMAYNWPESFDYWDENFKVTPYDCWRSDGAPLRCPHCHKEVQHYPRYFLNRKSLVPCTCEYAEIERVLQNMIDQYREDRTVPVLDQSLMGRRLFDRIVSDIKYYNGDKGTLAMYEKMGFDLRWKKILLHASDDELKI